MARSTPLVILVLALLQVVLAVPFSRSLIINKAAKGALRGHPFHQLTVKYNDLGDHDAVWSIESFEEGFSLSLLDNFFVNADNGKAILLPHGRKWYFENAGNGFYKIKLPNENLVLHWDVDSGGVLVEGANGGDEQLWQAQVPSSYYGRMYSQY